MQLRRRVTIGSLQRQKESMSDYRNLQPIATTNRDCLVAEQIYMRGPQLDTNLRLCASKVMRS